MNGTSRRAFLHLAGNAAIGVIGMKLIGRADAMPVATDLGQSKAPRDPLTEIQWGPPPRRPGWGPPPPPPPRRRRRRRWVCWWHRGRRHCGWRWS
jgi:hypothetical protein